MTNVQERVFERLDNQVEEVPENTDMIVMDFINTIVDLNVIGQGLRPRPGVEEFIEHYRSKGIPFFVCSDAREEGINKILKNLKLNHYFSGVYGDKHILRGHQKDVAKICKEQGVAPERTLMVGDAPLVDGSSAMRAGAKYLYVPITDKTFTFRKYLERAN